MYIGVSIFLLWSRPARALVLRPEVVRPDFVLPPLHLCPVPAVGATLDAAVAAVAAVAPL